MLAPTDHPTADLAPAYKIELARELRRRQTPAETLLWSRLRAHQLTVGRTTRRGNPRTIRMHFRRQHPIGRFVADFCCESLRLVVEVDGPYHEEPQQREFDAEREAHFTGRGYTILRFANREVLEETEAVIRRIGEVAQGLAAGGCAPSPGVLPSPQRCALSPGPSPSLPLRGGGGVPATERPAASPKPLAEK